MTRNQLLKAISVDNYWLYIVQNVENKPKIITIPQPFKDKLEVTETKQVNGVAFTPESFEIRFKINSTK